MNNTAIRETDAQRVERAAYNHVRMILDDRKAIAEAATRAQGLQALDRLTAIMHETPEAEQ